MTVADTTLYFGVNKSEAAKKRWMRPEYRKAQEATRRSRVPSASEVAVRRRAIKAAWERGEYAGLSEVTRKAWADGRYAKVDWRASGIKGRKAHRELLSVNSLLDVCNRTRRKVLGRLREKGVGCSRCGWLDGVCDLHHLVPRRDGGDDTQENLVLLCPNCHRLVGERRITLEGVKTLKEQIGDTWKALYYG